MDGSKSCISFFIPCSDKHHAWQDFKKLETKKQVLVGTITGLVAFFTLPLFGLLAMVTFRFMVNKFSAKKLDEESSTVEKTKEQAKILQEGENGTGAKATQALKRVGRMIQEIPLLREVLNSSRNKNIEILEARNEKAPIFYAIVNSKIKEVEKLIKEGVNLNQSDAMGSLPIHWAVRAGNMEIFKKVINGTKDLNVDVLDENKSTALNLAAETGKYDIVKFLIKDKKAKANIADVQGRIPLHNACMKGHTKIVSFLLGETKDTINAQDKGEYTALGLAVAGEKKDVVKLLLDHGANGNIKNQEKQSPLHIAAAKGNYDLVELLYKKTKDADINAKDSSDRTPLYLAVAGEHQKIVSFLLDKKAKTEIGDQFKKLPLHVAAETNEKILKLLLPASKEHINALDKEKNTPLNLAAFAGKKDCVKYLLESGADVNIANADGNLPLHNAAGNGHIEIVKLLLEKDAKQVNTPNSDSDNGGTALHFAAEEGHIDVVKFLLDSNADVKLKDVDGNLPLHAAAENGQTDIVKLLISKGTDVNAKGFQGKTALALATEKAREKAKKKEDAAQQGNAAAQQGDKKTEKACKEIEKEHAAAEKKYNEIARYLTDKGANP